MPKRGFTTTGQFRDRAMSLSFASEREMQVSGQRIPSFQSFRNMPYLSLQFRITSSSETATQTPSSSNSFLCLASTGRSISKRDTRRPISFFRQSSFKKGMYSSL